MDRIFRQCSDVSPDTLPDLVTGGCVRDIYDKSCIPATDCAELDFQLDICKKPKYYRTDFFACILGFVMLCDIMKSVIDAALSQERQMLHRIHNKKTDLS